jgi:predicted small lipoprotein YifL
MKRTCVAALTAALAVLSLAACGDSGTPPADKTTAAPEAAKDTPAPVAEAPVADKSAAESTVKRTPSPPGAKAFFIEPQDGATVKSPLTVKFGIEGMKIVPAGVVEPDSGHFHLLIDTTLKDYNAPIPEDQNDRHYGKGQTEATIELSPGKHTLQIILGDAKHIPHDPPVQSPVITVNVE